MLIKKFESSIAFYKSHPAIVNGFHRRSKFKPFLSANGLSFLIRIVQNVSWSNTAELNSGKVEKKKNDKNVLKLVGRKEEPILAAPHTPTITLTNCSLSLLMGWTPQRLNCPSQELDMEQHRKLGILGFTWLGC